MPKDIKEVAMRYLEHRERSAYEVREHLKTKGFSEQEIVDALEFLMEFHYVDDERYCDSYMRYGISKGKGPIKLRYELQEKGIRSDLIQLAMEEYYDSSKEKESAMKQVLKLTGSKGDTLEDNISFDEKEFAKIGRRLSNLGYSTSVIYDVIGKLRK